VRAAQRMDDFGQRHRVGLGREQFQHVQALFERRCAIPRISAAILIVSHR